jgi:hypothetical protein
MIRECLGQDGIEDALHGFLVLVIRWQEGHLVLHEEFACLAERSLLVGSTFEDRALGLDEGLRATTGGI